jgi:hypothetical protein
MTAVKMFSPFLRGGYLIMAGLGLSVARAKAAKVSIIMLTQRSMMVFRGEVPNQMVPKNTKNKHEMFVVI